MRIENNLSQDGLAALMPKRRHLSWVSGIENGKQEPSLSDLNSLAEALNVKVTWLLTGDASEDTEFTARLRGMEADLDESGKRTVLATAAIQVEETKKRAAEMAQNEQEASLLRLFRSLPVAERAALMRAAGAEGEPLPRRDASHQGQSTTQERIA